MPQNLRLSCAEYTWRAFYDNISTVWKLQIIVQIVVQSTIFGFTNNTLLASTSSKLMWDMQGSKNKFLKGSGC